MLDARTLCARCDIAAGEKLAGDYALFTVAPAWYIQCDWGAAECRGDGDGQ